MTVPPAGPLASSAKAGVSELCQDFDLQAETYMIDGAVQS